MVSSTVIFRNVALLTRTQKKNLMTDFRDWVRNGIPCALVSIPGSTKKEELCLKNM